MDNLVVVKHPLVQHKLSILRNKETSSAKFRILMHEISLLLAYEVTRDLSLKYELIHTPLTTMEAPVLKNKNLVFVSILRAGNGLVEGMLSLVPTARVGHIGLYREPRTLDVIEYYAKLPEGMSDADVIVVDPMLATGHTAIAAISEIKDTHPKSIRFLCLLAAPEGVAAVHQEHPEVAIYTASLDEHLNEKGYIVPGLGDAGDRLYGTKLV